MANRAIVPAPTLAAQSQVQAQSRTGLGASMPSPQATASMTAVKTAVSAAMMVHLISRVCHRLMGTGWR